MVASMSASASALFTFSATQCSDESLCAQSANAELPPEWKMEIYPNTDHEPSARDLMILQEQSGALDFWNDPAEDIYSETDGDPI